MMPMYTTVVGVHAYLTNFAGYNCFCSRWRISCGDHEEDDFSRFVVSYAKMHSSVALLHRCLSRSNAHTKAIEILQIN